jgi:hypothetical protein
LIIKYLGEDGGILHSQEASAGKFAVFDVQVQLAAALGQEYNNESTQASMH